MFSFSVLDLAVGSPVVSLAAPPKLLLYQRYISFSVDQVVTFISQLVAFTWRGI